MMSPYHYILSSLDHQRTSRITLAGTFTIPRSTDHIVSDFTIYVVTVSVANCEQVPLPSYVDGSATSMNSSPACRCNCCVGIPCVKSGQTSILDYVRLPDHLIHVYDGKVVIQCFFVEIWMKYITCSIYFLFPEFHFVAIMLSKIKYYHLNGLSFLFIPKHAVGG